MDHDNIALRQAVKGDYDALGMVMYDAIHSGKSDYTPDQRHAWLAAPYAGPQWATKLAAQHVVLAEAAGAPLGFMSLAVDGYVDLAFVAARAQGSGVFRLLYAQIEQAARTQGDRRLWTHASLMAQPAFEAVGFHVIRQERVARAGQFLDRAEMEKPLR
jgi:putative acetyltransferase